MLRRKAVLSMVAISLIGLLLTNPSYSQQEQSAQRSQRGQRGGQQGQRGQRGQQDQGQQGRRGQRSEQSQSDTERMQERLGATDQEWTVLEPRVMKVSEFSRQLRGGDRGRQRGGAQGDRGRQRGGSPDAQSDNTQRSGSRGDRSDSRQNTTGREQSALEKAQEQLRALLNNTSASPDQIKKQLAVVRSARARITQQLVAAQADLRKVITVRQEAQLVMMGMLD